jgi:hypothetical protein
VIHQAAEAVRVTVLVARARHRRWLSVLSWAAIPLIGCVGGLGHGGADVGHAPDSSPAGAECVDPGLQFTGSTTVQGRTPLGNFSAAGAWAFNQCVSVLLKQVDDRECLVQTLVVSTDLVVPPWPPTDGMPRPVRLSVRAEGTPPSRDEGNGTLVLEGENLGAREGVLRGQLSVRDGAWMLEGSFTAPWRYSECK